MQSYGLTVDKFLDHAAKWFGVREVVEADGGAVSRRIGYAALRTRSNRMSGALQALGLEFGDRVATLAWNTQHHLEAYYAAMGVGLVCHTLNPRLTSAHLVTMINEAQDRVLFVAVDLLPLVRALIADCPTIRHVVVIDAPAPDGAALDVRVWDYEALLAEHGAETVWGDFDEHVAAGLCYTSGTTGPPKGVVYTHRSNYLHTLRALQADTMALTARDVLLLGVPMFHANGWGLPFSAPGAGTKLVLPGRLLDGASLARVMRDERVTVAVGVQTVWLGLVDHLDRTGDALPDLQRILIGGSSCPEALLERMEERLGVHVQTSWGMTELSPTGTLSPPYPTGQSRASSGRPPLGVDLKLTDALGVTLPDQRDTLGYLKVRGPSVLDRYFQAESDALDEEGYFDTGDLATIDADGNLTIGGRAKDLIKSGGEWINPNEIEAVVGMHPSVRHVAVIARPDPRWGERPVLVVETHGDGETGARVLLDLLRGKVAEFWIPDQVAEVTAMPLAATGKIDKVRLSADFAAGRIAVQKVAR
ncbi:AMP-binding protein [Sphingomonas sp. PAMC 26605]|uniref:AMP-binding protein n=1 Tax=Sphingomonas sp. PAMC 26605 TaxID=1112214 RepID=UPI0005680F9B|nr:AMP-binding protein [Sphingomonas sp. PAMC 26605]